MGNQGSSLDEILAEDMHHWYNKFMRESPSGLITLFELKAILNLKGMNETANSYVDQVFFTFDMDGVCKTAFQAPGPDWPLIREVPTQAFWLLVTFIRELLDKNRSSAAHEGSRLGLKSGALL